VSGITERFTARFTEQELRLLNQTAEENSTSVNSVLRVAVRAAYGLTVPRWAGGPARRPTTTGGNDRNGVAA
jgi:hypothetical protein